MLKHIVMWKLKDHAEGADKASNIVKAVALLRGCAQLTPETLAFEVATASPGLETTYDIVLYSVFTDRAALDAYQQHPDHVAIKPFLGAVVEQRQCMDYETTASA